MAYDVAIIGGGPAGAACAAICAHGGLRTLMLERTEFPREKVCGDCLNPLAWPVLEQLGLADQVRQLPHARLREVEIASSRGQTLRAPLPAGPRGEIGLRRKLLDDLLLQQAARKGAEVRTSCALERLAGEGPWQLSTPTGTETARWLIAADGRNSTVARLRGLLPPARRDRVARQTRLPRLPHLDGRVAMRFLPWGYSGLADIGGSEMNLCLVARPEQLDRLHAWAAVEFQTTAETSWQSITPLSRRALAPVQGALWLVGDAARVVEPFTGEGISYALASGAAAGAALVAGQPQAYAQAHRKLYAGRLWINQLLRAACLQPKLADAMWQAARAWPSLLRFLTRKIAGEAP